MDGENPRNFRGAPDGRVLTPQELAALRVLLESSDRVVGRRELSRRLGLTGVNERRCDSLLVGIRRSLGSDSIRTVRGRGWMLDRESVEVARSILRGT